MGKRDEYIGDAVLFAYFTIVPLIMHHGFLDITNTKMWAYITLTGCYALFFIFSFVTGKIRLKNSIFTDLLIIWTVIVILSCVLSEAGKFAFSGIAARNNGGFLLLAYAIAAFCFERIGRLKRIHVYALLVVGVVVAVLGIANNAGFDPLGTLLQIVGWQRNLYASTIGQIDIYVSFFAIVLPISVYNIWHEKRMTFRILNAFFSIIYIAAMFISGCESVYITFFVLVITYGICLMRKNKCFVLMPAAAISAMLIFLAENPALLRLSDTWGNNRGFIWKQGMDYYIHAGLKDKLIGIGPDSVGLVFHWHYGISATVINGSTYDNLHNLFFQILVTTGALGLFTFLALCIVAIYNLLRSGTINSSGGNYNIPISIALICYLAQSVVNISSPATLGILVVMVSIGQKKREEN